MDYKGIIQINRTFGGRNAMFGSSIEHDVVMKLSINTCEVDRSFSTDRYYPVNNIIEIELTPAQYAEMITNLNHGVGVPCTITKFQGKRIKNDLKLKDEIETFKKEYKQNIDEVFNNMKDYINSLDYTKPLSPKKIKEIKERLRILIYSLENEGPFLSNRFNEYIEKVFVEAQSKIENNISLKLQNLGIEKLNELQIKKQLENKE